MSFSAAAEKRTHDDSLVLVGVVVHRAQRQTGRAVGHRCIAWILSLERGNIVVKIMQEPSQIFRIFEDTVDGVVSSVPFVSASRRLEAHRIQVE